MDDFIAKHGADFKTYSKEYKLRDLFALNHSDLDAAAVKAFRAARKAGLLWCRSIGEFQTLDGNVVITVANKKKCNVAGTACDNTGDPDDYCQIVDGECNTMSS
ncbi:MAG: hypothetical protein VCD00_08295 [Candidatus Hydrogenedentota bacterium]